MVGNAMSFGNDELGQRAPKGFPLAPAEHVFGTGIPRDDGGLSVYDDDRVERRLENELQRVVKIGIVGDADRRAGLRMVAGGKGPRLEAATQAVVRQFGQSHSLRERTPRESGGRPAGLPPPSATKGN